MFAARAILFGTPIEISLQNQSALSATLCVSVFISDMCVLCVGPLVVNLVYSLCVSACVCVFVYVCMSV